MAQPTSATSSQRKSVGLTRSHSHGNQTNNHRIIEVGANHSPQRSRHAAQANANTNTAAIQNEAKEERQQQQQRTMVRSPTTRPIALASPHTHSPPPARPPHDAVFLNTEPMRAIAHHNPPCPYRGASHKGGGGHMSNPHRLEHNQSNFTPLPRT